MEAVEESMGTHGVDAIAKRKRTKRQRVLLPAAAASSTSSAEFSSCTTEEEEDMANCLILLAQGGQKQEQVADEGGGGGSGGGGGAEKFTSRRFAEAATTTNGKVGFYVYECKTCSRCFPSFQALGGHRASHKKPKTAAPARNAGDEKKAAADEDGPHLSMNSFAAPFIAPAKPRVHECSICGSEFSSGQALGGHMRRHRPSGTAETAHDSKKERSLLSLDLNLPAPPEDGLGEFGKPPAAFNQPPLVFSAPALVDCHY